MPSFNECLILLRIKEQGKSMEELLLFDVCSSSSLFDEEGLSATKSNILSKSYRREKVLKSYHLGA